MYAAWTKAKEWGSHTARVSGEALGSHSACWKDLCTHLKPLFSESRGGGPGRKTLVLVLPRPCWQCVLKCKGPQQHTDSAHQIPALGVSPTSLLLPSVALGPSNPFNTRCSRKARVPGNPDPWPPPARLPRPVLSKVGFRETRAGLGPYGRFGPDPLPAPERPCRKGGGLFLSCLLQVAINSQGTWEPIRESPFATQRQRGQCYPLYFRPCCLH